MSSASNPKKSPMGKKSLLSLPHKDKKQQVLSGFAFLKNHFLPLFLTIFFLYLSCHQGAHVVLKDVFPWIHEPFGFIGFHGALFQPNGAFLLTLLYLTIGTVNLCFLAFYLSLEEFFLGATFVLFMISQPLLGINILFLTIYGLFIFLPLVFFSLGKIFYKPKETEKLKGMEKIHEKQKIQSVQGILLFFYALFVSNVMFLSLSWNALTEKLPLFRSCFWLPGALGLFFGSCCVWFVLFFLDKINLKTKNFPSLHGFYYWFLAGCQIMGLFLFQEFIEFFTNIFLIGCLPFVYEGIHNLWIHKSNIMRNLSPTLKTLGGILSTLCIFPPVVFFIYSLFHPWIPKMKNSQDMKK